MSWILDDIVNSALIIKCDLLNSWGKGQCTLWPMFLYFPFFFLSSYLMLHDSFFFISFVFEKLYRPIYKGRFTSNKLFSVSTTETFFMSHSFLKGSFIRNRILSLTNSFLFFTWKNILPLSFGLQGFKWEFHRHLKWCFYWVIYCFCFLPLRCFHCLWLSNIHSLLLV